jgi:hypothetical protein
MPSPGIKARCTPARRRLSPAGTWRDIDMTTVGDDGISSIRVSPGYLARACQNANGTTCVTYSSSLPFLGAYDNTISWLRVSPAVTLYDGTNFTSTSQTLGVGSHGSAVLATGVGNDHASSLIAAPGINVRLCSENGGWGTCQEFGGRVADLGSPLNGNTSNVEVRPGVSVYRDPAFGGVQQTFRWARSRPSAPSAATGSARSWSRPATRCGCATAPISLRARSTPAGCRSWARR